MTDNSATGRAAGREQRNYVVTGASSGLGLEIAYQLAEAGKRVVNVSMEPSPAELHGDIICDLSDPQSIADVRPDILKSFAGQPVDVLVNCAGINYIDYMENVALGDWQHVMDVNVQAPFLMVQGLLPHLKRSAGTVLNIISNASHMPMTASAAYNASKGALHILTLQMARELTRRWGIIVFGISPNKLAGTGMSKYIEERVPVVRGWTPERAQQYQEDALLLAEATSPVDLARFIAYLLMESNNHRWLTGCVLPYGA